jgi:hypothetical protein
VGVPLCSTKPITEITGKHHILIDRAIDADDLAKSQEDGSVLGNLFISALSLEQHSDGLDASSRLQAMITLSNYRRGTEELDYIKSPHAFLIENCLERKRELNRLKEVRLDAMYGHVYGRGTSTIYLEIQFENGSTAC